MRDDWNVKIALVGAVALAALVLAVVAVARGGATESVCPDGQELVGFTAGNFKAEQKPLPEGYTIRDRFGNATVRSDGDSASGNVPLTIECR